MTDKEKAEEYVLKELGISPNSDTGFLCKKVYFDGQKAGRKESEKENTELKEEIGRLKIELKALNRTIADLKIEKTILTKTVSRSGYRIAELKHKNDELKSQLSDIKNAIKNYSQAESYQAQMNTWELLLEFIN